MKLFSKFSRHLTTGLVMTLAGCSSSNLLPPSVPSGAELSSYAQADFHPPYQLGATPEETLIIGISYVDQKCAEFFDAVEQTNRKLEVGRSTFATASTQTLVVMNLAKASTLAVAQVAAALETTKVLLDEYQQEFAFAPHSVELRAITMTAMTAQKKEFGDILSRNPSSIGSQVAVIAAVKQYAQGCTLSQIREHWNTAIARAVERGVKPSPSASNSAQTNRADRALGFPAPRTILGVNKYVVR
jgi:hypothetical protein